MHVLVEKALSSFQIQSNELQCNALLIIFFSNIIKYTVSAIIGISQQWRMQGNQITLYLHLPYWRSNAIWGQEAFRLLGLQHSQKLTETLLKYLVKSDCSNSLFQFNKQTSTIQARLRKYCVLVD